MLGYLLIEVGRAACSLKDALIELDDEQVVFTGEPHSERVTAVCVCVCVSECV